MEFEALYLKQARLIHSINRALPNFKKLGKANWTLPVTKGRIIQLQTTFGEMRELDAKLQQIATEDHKSSHQYFSDKHSIAANQSGPNLPVQRPISHLPRIDITKFDGTLTQWETFRDRFNALIIKNASLSNVERMYYLCSILTGDASRAIQHLSVVDSSFEIAWAILVSRYDNTRRLVATHVQALLAISTVLSETCGNLQALRDTVNSSVQALRNLDRPVDYWDDILVHLVAQRLDKTSRKAWELQLGDDTECPDYASLDRFLATRIRALEALAPVSISDLTHSKSAKPPRFSSHGTTASKFATKPACSLCKRNHSLYQCPTFITYASSRRREFIKEHRCCFNCLAPGHSTSSCPSERRCKECSQPHHTLLHISNKPIQFTDGTANIADQPESTTERFSSHVAFGKNISTVLLATARVRVSSPMGRSIIVRALLDQGSEVSLITRNLAQIIRLPLTPRRICVTGVGEANSIACHAAPILISPISQPSLVYQTNAVILRSLSQYVPPRISGSWSWSHISQLSLADPDPFGPDPVELIIGSELYGQLLCEGLRHGKRNEPIAQLTTLGWILSGPVSAQTTKPGVAVHHFSVSEDLDATIRHFWEIEEIPISRPLDKEEEECEKHFLDTHSRDENGRYVVRLPFRNDGIIALGESRSTALAHLLRLERRLSRDDPTRKAYNEFIQEYQTLGHLAPIPNYSTDKITRITESPHYYIPHHAVIRTNSSTTKLRVVFNASCATNSSSSLNDLLLIGPKLQTDLVAVLLQWRQHRYVCTADIEKMYRQILVNPRDTDYQRILWRPNPRSTPREYRLLTVTYGIASAPFLALRVLKQLAHDEGHKFPEALPVLNRQSYVDDVTFGAEDLNTTRWTRDQIIAILATAGFRLRKWASNAPSLLHDIYPSDHGLAQSRDIQSDESLAILGLTWLPSSDIFRCRVSCPTDTSNSK